MYFVISNNFSIEEYPENDFIAQNEICYLEKIDTGKTNTTSYGNVYKIYQYKVLNYEKKKLKIEKSGWNIIQFTEPLGKNLYDSYSAKISDPDGKIRYWTDSSRMSFPLIKGYEYVYKDGNVYSTSHAVGYDEERAFLQAIQVLYKLADYKNFEQFDLYFERDEEIRELQMQNEFLLNLVRQCAVKQ